MSQDRATKLAMELMRIGVSRAGTAELLAYPLEVIERQLAYLPFRKAKRPSAFIVDAVRNDYSPPKEAYYAKAETDLAGAAHPVDEGSERPAGPVDAVPQGHGTPDTAGPGPSDLGVEPGGPPRYLDLP